MHFCRTEKYLDYKFHMLVDDFGYENLLFMLAKKGIKVFLDDKTTEIFKRQDILHHFCNDRNEAKITVVNHLDTNNVEKQFTESKIISIAFTSDRKGSESNAVQFIRFSIHPTMADISFIAGLAAPLNIYTIGHSIDFPYDLNYLCRYDEKNDRKNRPKSQKC